MNSNPPNKGLFSGLNDFLTLETALWRKSSVFKAMKAWEEKTCIRFKERTDEKDYVEFFADFGK